jgi:hypothetical protein
MVRLAHIWPDRRSSDLRNNTPAPLAMSTIHYSVNRGLSFGVSENPDHEVLDLAATGGLVSTLLMIGIVVRMPTAKNAHPAPLR